MRLFFTKKSKSTAEDFFSRFYVLKLGKKVILNFIFFTLRCKCTRGPNEAEFGPFRSQFFQVLKSAVVITSSCVIISNQFCALGLDLELYIGRLVCFHFREFLIFPMHCFPFLRICFYSDFNCGEN